VFEPVENIGATLIKEAARNTVYEAGDGTTTATVLAEALIKEVDRQGEGTSIREIKEGINSGLKKVNEYLEKIAISIEGSMLESVSTITCFIHCISSGFFY
jgi:chaperonin GroEL